jgi:D-arabinose 1-dehydrogenase-like Zn-dependent alcohol dehydrogenase
MPTRVCAIRFPLVTDDASALIPTAGADFQIVDREIPQPGPEQVRIKVQACGVCHSDMFTKEGLWPGIEYPRVPGHEVAGIVDEVGAGVSEWKKGQRVGVAASTLLRPSGIAVTASAGATMYSWYPPS